MARLGGERRSQVPSLCTLADGCLGGSSAWGGRSTSSRPQFSARLLRLGSIADSFQHAPEARGSAAGGGHHVAGAQGIQVAEAHFHLQFGQATESSGDTDY